jgi:hypothetical protein
MAPTGTTIDFGPATTLVADVGPTEAPPLDRLLGATGRNPAWQRET